MPRTRAVCGKCGKGRLPSSHDGLCCDCRQMASYTRPTCKVCDRRCQRTPDRLCGECRRDRGKDALVARCSICEQPIPVRRTKCRRCRGEAVPA